MVLWDSNSMMAFWRYTFGVCFEAANHPPPQKKIVLGKSDGQGPPHSTSLAAARYNHWMQKGGLTDFNASCEFFSSTHRHISKYICIGLSDVLSKNGVAELGDQDFYLPWQDLAGSWRLATGTAGPRAFDWRLVTMLWELCGGNGSTVTYQNYPNTI